MVTTSTLEQPIVQRIHDADPLDATGSETVYLALGPSSELLYEGSDAGWPSPFPLATLADGRFRVLAPFDVSFLTEGDSVVAEAPEINEFGFGPTHSEAVRDLQAAIVELSLTLRGEQDNLGADLLEVWETLLSKVRIQYAD